MSGAAWERILGACGIPARSPEAAQLGGYLTLLEKWNRRINLTSSTRETDLAPLVEESVWAARLYGRRLSGCRAPRHLDIGSGSGFPALPLRILNPRMRLTLLESREKKALFLERVVGELGLDGVEVCCQRLSARLNMPPETHGWNTVSWKAIRLAAADWQELLGVSAPGVEYWLFHGEELPVESPDEFRSRLTAALSVPVPHRQNSYLSIYQ